MSETGMKPVSVSIVPYVTNYRAMISLQHTVAKAPPSTDKYTSSFIWNYNMIVVFFPRLR